jgi:hypothetical protein
VRNARSSAGAFALLFVVGLALALPGSRARAHAIPRLYASIGPAAAYDPLQGVGFLGGTLLLGLGVDPERDALLVRVELFAAVGRGDGVGGGAAILYRAVLSSSDSVLVTWALGLGALAFGDEDAGVTIGARGELSARLGDHVAFTVFVLTGPCVGELARIPWGLPIGAAIELGLP